MIEEVTLEFLSRYNPWWIDGTEIDNDLKIIEFEKSCIKYQHPVLKKFDLNQDVIYTLRGSRQIGKSTILKLLIRDLLRKKSNPRNIFFFPGDYLRDYKELYSVLDLYIGSCKKTERKYIFIDEISFVKDWTRTIKLLADEGKLKKCSVLLTGSLSIFVKGENEFMPGRRGKVQYLDKILYPLSFGEYVKIVDKKIYEALKIDTEIVKLENKDIQEKTVFVFEKYHNRLKRLWLDYLFTGGYYINIEHFIKNKKLLTSNCVLYLEAIKGDWLKLNREEFVLKETMNGIIRHLGSTTSWLGLAKESSVQSHLTMASSVELLEKLFVVKSLHNIDLNQKLPNLRKEKKIFVLDPFNLLLFSAYIESREDYPTIYQNLRKDKMPEIVESVVNSHLLRYYKNSYFYRSRNTEVDFVGQNKEKFFGYEVKYQNKISQDDFKSASLFDKFTLISKDRFIKSEAGLTIPYLWALLNLDKSYEEEN